MDKNEIRKYFNDGMLRFAVRNTEKHIILSIAKTIAFEYKAIDKDVKQYCEMSVVKFKNSFYVIYSMSRYDGDILSHL